MHLLWMQNIFLIFGWEDTMDVTVVGDKGVSPAVIRVIGAGGAGGNAINRMIECGLENIDFIAANTDAQVLQTSSAPIKIPLGSKLTGGLGAGGKPEVGEKAAMEDAETIKEVLKGSDMVFITAGMGGGTGTGAAPVIAKIAREMGALTVGVVTKPFDYEGKVKMRLADEGIKKLRNSVDTLIVIPNQHLMKIIDKRTPLKEAFRSADEVLRRGVQCISDLITCPGLMNLDFADVTTIMQDKGDAIMGTGIGQGENRAVDAATNAINNPLLEDSRIEGAKNILINITGDDTLSLTEIAEISDIVTASAADEVLVKVGAVFDQSMNEQIMVSVIATGFNKEEEVREEEKPSTIAALNANVQTEKKTDIFDMDRFIRITGDDGRNADRGPSPKLPSHVPSPDDIEVPTFLRRQGTYHTTKGDN